MRRSVRDYKPIVIRWIQSSLVKSRKYVGPCRTDQFVLEITSRSPYTLLHPHNLPQRHTSEHLNFVEAVIIALYIG